MFKFRLNRWLKTSVFALVFSIGMLCVGLPTFSTNDLADYSTGASVAYANNEEGGLATGGSGLSLERAEQEGEVTISGSISHRTFGDTLKSMVNYFIGFLGFLTTIAFVYAGTLWILSGGNEETITKSKKIMTYATLGLVVVILSFSAVEFITSSAGDRAPSPTAGGECRSDGDCDPGFSCIYDNESLENICVDTTTLLGGNVCRDNLDCPLGFACNENTQRCEPSDTPGLVTGSPTVPAVNENLDAIDDLVKDLEGDLDISDLPEELQDAVETALSSGDLDENIAEIEQMLNDPDLSPSEARILERLIDGLSRLKLLREELDKLENTIEKSGPKSDEILATYQETSDSLNSLLDNPTNMTKVRRFDRDYRKLKELIRKFPVVQARIRAMPGEGNVPFTVQLDGLDSSDPTGGTISEYRWTYLDNNGSEVSLGSDPVVTTEFDEPNTYAVRLRVSTSQVDDEGYATAMDGISIVRIRAKPPTSKVNFRINGVDAEDIFNVTLKEAQAGITFDPSTTEAAVGRRIEKYEWFYGDTISETRNVPTTVIHTYDKVGEYFVKLLVTDNLGIKDKRIVKLFVKSLAADIKITPTTGNVNTEYGFVGIGSRSDDGMISSYQWEIQDSEGRIIVESEDDTFYHRFTRPGTYSVILLVTDITGASDKFVKELEVLSRDPVVSFNFSIPEQNHPNRVEFNAVDSYDPDEGDTITYSWDFDGDGDFEITDGEEAVVTHEYSKIGEYRAKLQIEDAFNKRNQIEKKVSVRSVLSADIVTERRATRVGEPIELSAESPVAVAYLWEFGDGETESTEETSTEHVYNKTGKFTVKLNFFDAGDNDNSASKRILVGAGDEPLAVADYLVNGRAPRVIENLCGEDQEGAVVARADMLRFNAKNSINTDGSSRLLSYDWKLPNGEKSSNKDLNFKFDEINREGECFSASLVVRDQITGKLSQKDEIFFKVINKLPQITDFVITPPDKEDLVTPVKIKLKAINPKDLDGTIKKYKWWYYREGFEDEKLGVHSTPTSETDMVITSLGESDLVNRYFFVLEITDNDNGAYDTEERFGEVSYLDVKNGPNLSPVAEFTLDKTMISVGDSITFISRSYDPQGDTLPNDAFRWDFDGDGEFDDSTSGPQVNRQFNTPGEYNVRLKVVYRGLSSSATKTIFVETTESLPQAAFTYTVKEDTVTFDGNHSRFDPTLEDATLRFEWDFDINDDANGNGIKDDDLQATEAQTTYTYPEKDVYKARLKVKDYMGMEGVVVRDVDLSLTEEERQKNAYHSLKVSAPRYPLTTLDLDVIPAILEKGGSSDIKVRVLNADGTPYTGNVFFEVIDGSGEFTPNPVGAENSKASAIFTALDKGKVRIRVRATETLYGELTEEATLNVK